VKSETGQWITGASSSRGLYVNVSALRFDRESRFAIDLDLSGCGVS
jgi:hypothetical protein